MNAREAFGYDADPSLMSILCSWSIFCPPESKSLMTGFVKAKGGSDCVVCGCNTIMVSRGLDACHREVSRGIVATHREVSTAFDRDH